MSATATTLEVSTRTPEGSRSARRLRRQGLVPGVVYGGDGDCVSIQVDALALNRSLAGAGAVVDLAIDGETTNVIVKDTQRHPVNGRPLHVDFLRVRMDVAIASEVVIELEGAEDAPGAKEGGVLEQVTREVNVEALPRDIPDSITLDVSGMEMNDTLTLEALKVPDNVQLLDEPETVLATVTPPKLSVEPDEELETETELVGEEGEAAEEGDEGEESSDSDGEQGTVPG
jgi:large subunit ribosomal protein L25